MKLKKLLSSVLAASMLLSSMAFTAFAEDATTPTYAAVITSADDLGVGAEDEYSTVYYGGIPWRVLTKDYLQDSTDATSKKGILLMSEHAMANGIRYNAHYSHSGWSSTNKAWASAQWMSWDDERNPNYASNIANGTKTDDSSGGYITSDVRMYLTGGDEYSHVYESVRPYAFFNESWPANWWGTPDKNSKANKYYTREVVTEAEPVDGVTYFVKGDFELSNHNRNEAKVNGVAVPGMVAITPGDWAEDTWYTLDTEGNPVLMTEYPMTDDDTPVNVESVNAYYDQAGYTIADVSNGFEDGVTYYTFARWTQPGDAVPAVTTNGTEYAMGEHLSGLFLYVAYAIPALTNTSPDNAIVDEVFASGLDASEKNFTLDMGFTEIEQDAVLPTSGHGYTRGTGYDTGVGGTYGDRLANDTYFLLSGEEVNEYLHKAGHTKPATYLDGVTGVGDIWTRSWGKSDTQCVVVYTNNKCSWRQGDNNTWQSIRPAFNLNPDAVVMYVPAEDDVFAKMTAGNNEYKMVMLDDARADFTYTVTPSENGATITYENAIVGENEWITAVVMDADGNITHYGEVAEVETANGTIELAITGEEMVGKQLYIFNEQCNGDYETNYSNAFGEGFKIVTSKTLAEALEDMEHSETLAVQTENNGIVEVVKINDEEFEVAERYIKINDNAEGIEVTVPGIIEVAVEEGNGQKDYKVVVDLEKTSYDSEVATVDLDISLKCTYNGVTEDVEANGKKFEVTVKLPENADLSVIPTVYHNGVEISGVKVVGGCVVFTTDGFSPYAISYQLKAVNAPAVDEMCSAAQVEFVLAKENENNTIYDIVIKSTDGKDIFGLVSAQMDISEDADMSGVNFTVEGANDFIVTDNEADDSYLFTLKTANNQALADTKSGESVKVGKLTISGFTTDIETGVVGTYTVNATIDANDGAGTSYLDTDVTPNETKNIFIALTGNSIDYEKDVPKNELTIEVTFPKNINDNNYNYQDMKITVTEQDRGKVAEFDLGVAGDAQIDDNKYTVSAELQRYKTYTVKIEGAGYRTFTKTVDLDADKTMIVWNNYKDNGALIIKDGETTPEAVATITFLAGDIVKDNTVNAYDLSVLLSYAFTDGIDTTATSKYAQYDLNRDGLINYKDAAMILDTYVWGK